MFDYLFTVGNVARLTRKILQETTSWLLGRGGGRRDPKGRDGGDPHVGRSLMERRGRLAKCRAQAKAGGRCPEAMASSQKNKPRPTQWDEVTRGTTQIRRKQFQPHKP